jgi:hypothetical protein
MTLDFETGVFDLPTRTAYPAVDPDPTAFEGPSIHEVPGSRPSVDTVVR